MSAQNQEDDINLLKGAINFLTQRIALQEQIGHQLREAQQSELATIHGLCKELAKLKSQIAVLSVRQTALESKLDQGDSGDDGELPLLLKNSGNKSNKNHR